MVREPSISRWRFTRRDSQAVAQLSGPRLLPLELDSIAQIEEICNPPVPPVWKPFAFEMPSLPAAGVLLAGGFLLGAALK